MPESFNYKNGIMPRETKLTLEELEALLLNNGGVIRKHPGNLGNFIARVIKSFTAQQDTIIQLNRDIAAIQASSESKIHPVDRALKALENLTVEQTEQVLERNYTREILKLNKATEDNELLRLGYINENNRVRGVLMDFLKKATLSEADKAALAKALEDVGYRLN